MNRITCKLMGGLGNQLFQVATTLVTAVTQNNRMLPVFIDEAPMDWDERKKLESYKGPRPNYWSSIFHQLMLVTKADGYIEYHENPDHKFRQIPQMPINTKIIGYWQSPKYFEHQRTELIQAFTLPKEDMEYVNTKYSQLSNGKKTLGIHVRRTDYQLINNTIPLDYYLQSLGHFPDGSLKVLIFSDDKKWCQANLEKILKDKSFEYVNEVDYHELFLMSLCDNLIIANSSFSWWGAYLSQKVNKVICPTPWLINKDTGKEECPDIYPDLKEWTKLDYRGKNDVIHIASDPVKTGRLCNKLFQLSHLLALKYDITAKTQKQVVIHYNIDEYKYLKNFTNLQPIDDTKLRIWQQPGFEYSEVPQEYYSTGFMVSGYVQSAKFFEKHRDEVIERWKSLQIGCDPRTADTIFTQLVGNIPQETPVIALHVRRTDYLTLPHHPAIPLKYYFDALELMETRLGKSRKECKYLIFSDDPEWTVKQKWGVNFTVVNSRHVKESNGVPDNVLDYIDLLIMSKCHAFIIANSTFSWWGAYLSRSKYVIYPDPWFASHLASEKTDDLCPDWWVGLRWSKMSPIEIVNSVSNFLHLNKSLTNEYKLGLSAIQNSSSGEFNKRTPKALDDLIVNACRVSRYHTAIEIFEHLLNIDSNREYIIKHRQRLMYNINYISPSLVDKLKPIVSVIIPSYRRVDKIKRAITSALSQSLKDIEVIVVNDASPEKEYLCLDQFFNDSRLKVIHLTVNTRVKYGAKIPQGLTRMEGIKQSSGAYIAFLDDDDYWCDNNKLSKQLNALSEANEMDSITNANLIIPKLKYRMSSTNMVKSLPSGYDEKYSLQEQPNNGKYLTHFKYDTQLSNQRYKFTAQTIADVNYINCSTVLVERKVFMDAGGMRDESPEDYPCWKRVLQFTDNLYLDECTTWYDLGTNNKKYYTQHN
jgi:hypothetical protein